MLNKTYLLFCINILLSITLYSCSNSTEIENNNTIKASINPFSSRIIINAENESLKTYWNNNDQIGVFGNVKGNNLKYNLIKGANTKNGEFAPSNNTYNGDIIAYYPYNENNNNIVLEDNKIKNLSFSNQQTFYANSPDPKACYMIAEKSDNENIAFKNIFSIIHIKVKSSSNEIIKEIICRDNSNENISGSFNVLFQNNNKLKTEFISESSKESNSISLNCGNNGITLQNNIYTDFYIVIPSKIYNKGISMQFINKDNLSLTKIILSNGGEINPSVCYDLPAIDDMNINGNEFSSNMGDYSKDDSLVWD